MSVFFRHDFFLFLLTFGFFVAIIFSSNQKLIKMKLLVEESARWRKPPHRCKHVVREKNKCRHLVRFCLLIAHDNNCAPNIEDQLTISTLCLGFLAKRFILFSIQWIKSQKPYQKGKTWLWITIFCDSLWNHFSNHLFSTDLQPKVEIGIFFCWLCQYIVIFFRFSSLNILLNYRDQVISSNLKLSFPSTTNNHLYNIRNEKYNKTNFMMEFISEPSTPMGPIHWRFHMRRYMQEIVPRVYLGPYASASKSNVRIFRTLNPLALIELETHFTSLLGCRTHGKGHHSYGDDTEQLRGGLPARMVSRKYQISNDHNGRSFKLSHSLLSSGMF